MTDDQEPELTFEERARRLLEIRKLPLIMLHEPDHERPKTALEREADRIEAMNNYIANQIKQQRERDRKELEIMEAREQGRLEGARTFAGFMYNCGLWKP